MPHMTLLIVSFLFLFLFPLRTCNAYYKFQGRQPPNPNPRGFVPGKNFEVISFHKGFKTLWGKDHQNVSKNGVLKLKLDKYSGSGFISRKKYKAVYLGAEIKLPNVSYTAGLDISLYLSSKVDCSKNHDEIDIEFLGSVDGSHFYLQTNVIITDHSSLNNEFNKLGREQVFRLWFDPRLEFHRYSVVKTRISIVFFVDDYPIRRFVNRKDGLYPMSGLRAYGSIWDASDWATEGGMYRVNYSDAPFIAKYKKFQFTHCKGKKGCSVTPSGTLGLSTAQKHTMQWIQDHYLVYDYCSTYADPSLSRECPRHAR